MRIKKRQQPSPGLRVIVTLVSVAFALVLGGLVILAISFEREKDTEKRRAMVREFVEQHAVNYLVLDGGSFKDFETSLPNMRDVEGFPVEVLIDRCGDVVDTRNGYGYRRIWAKHLEQRIVEQLNRGCESEEED